MNIPRSALYAVAFVVLVAILGLSVWLVLLPRGQETASGADEPGFFGSLFPFGNTDQTPPLGAPEGPNFGEFGVVPELRKVTDEPVAGARYVTSSTTELIRYTERDTGHMYETPVAFSTSVRLTNSTVPGVHDSTWITGSSTLLRFLSDEGTVQNFVAQIASTTEDQTLTGNFIKDYVRIAFGSRTAVAVLETQTGSVVESLDLLTGSTRTLFSSVLRSWIPHTSAGRYFLTQAPSGRAQGSIYEIESLELTRVVEERPGLQALFQKNGPLVAVTGGSQNTLSLAVYDLSNGGMVEIPVGTIVQKCAWAEGSTPDIVCAIPRAIPRGMYPDDWLLGLVHTDDDVYRINTDTGAITRVFNLNESGNGPFDVSQAALSDDGAYFLFVNRLDQTLWSAKLTP